MVCHGSSGESRVSSYLKWYVGRLRSIASFPQQLPAQFWYLYNGSYVKVTEIRASFRFGLFLEEVSVGMLGEIN